MSTLREKVEAYLKEDINEFEKIKEPADIETINDNPEKKQGEEIQISPEVDVFAPGFVSPDFIQKIKPIIGKVKKGKLMLHHIQLAQKNKDMLIFKCDDKEYAPFYAFDRDEFVAFMSISPTEDSIAEEDKKILKKRVDYVLTREQSTILFEDYMDMVIDHIISITSFNPEVKMPSGNAPSIEIPEGDK